jgi:hypothetical protein
MSFRQFQGFALPFFTALLVLAALASPMLAQTAAIDGSAITAGAKDAASQFQTYLDGVAKAGGRPDFSKPPASDLWGRIFDLKQLASLPPPQASEASWLPGWLASASGTAKSIFFFNVTLSDPLSADQVAALKRNASEYQDQDTIGLDFMIRLSARLAQSVSLFMDQLTPEQRTPIREAGVDRMRNGDAETIYGALDSIAQGMKPANARLLSGAMSDTRDVWASFIPPQYRSQIMGQIAAAKKAAKDDKVQDDLATLGATLAAAK